MDGFLTSLFILFFLLSPVCLSPDEIVCDAREPRFAIDAAVKMPSGDIFVFHDKYVSKIRGNITPEKFPEVADGYPTLITELWPESRGRIQAAFALKGTVYLLKSNGTWTLGTNGKKHTGDVTRALNGNIGLIDGITVLSYGHHNHLFAFHTQGNQPLLSIFDLSTDDSVYSHYTNYNTTAVEFLGKFDSKSYQGLHFSSFYFNWFSLANSTLAQEQCFYPNEVLMGCPQPLCYSAKMDAIAKYGPLIYIFVGKYVYEVMRKERNVLNVLLIKDAFHPLEANVDAALSFNSQMYIFKERDMITSLEYGSWELSTPQAVLLQFAGAPKQVDAAFYYELENVVYIIKSTTFWKIKVEGNVMSVLLTGSTLEISTHIPLKVDAMLSFPEEDAVYVYRENYSFKVTATGFMAQRQVTKQLIQESLLRCNETEGYDESVRKMLFRCEPTLIETRFAPIIETNSTINTLRKISGSHSTGNYENSSKPTEVKAVVFAAGDNSPVKILNREEKKGKNSSCPCSGNKLMFILLMVIIVALCLILGMRIMLKMKMKRRGESAALAEHEMRSGGLFNIYHVVNGATY